MSMNTIPPGPDEGPPEWFSELPLELQVALVELGVAPEEWLTDQEYIGAPPEWVQQQRSLGYFGFLSPVGLGPLYMGGMFTRAFTAGWLTQFGLDPGAFGYPARTQVAQARSAAYALWGFRGAMYGNAQNWGYMQAQSYLWQARAVYYNFQQQFTPPAEVWGGVRLASYFNPQAWVLRAFGFPIYGAAMQIAAGAAMAPSVQAAYAANPARTMQVIQTSPTFWSGRLPTWEEQVIGGLAEWTALQSAMWLLQGSLTRGALAVNIAQGGLGIMMGPLATLAVRSMWGVPFTPQEWVQFGEQELLGGTMFGVGMVGAGVWGGFNLQAGAGAGISRLAGPFTAGELFFGLPTMTRVGATRIFGTGGASATFWEGIGYYESGSVRAATGWVGGLTPEQATGWAAISRAGTLVSRGGVVPPGIPRRGGLFLPSQDALDRYMLARELLGPNSIQTQIARERLQRSLTVEDYIRIERGEGGAPYGSVLSRLIWGTIGWYGGAYVGRPIGGWIGENMPGWVALAGRGLMQNPYAMAIPGVPATAVMMQIMSTQAGGEVFGEAVGGLVGSYVAMRYGPRLAATILSRLGVEFAVPAALEAVAGGALSVLGPILALEAWGVVANIGIDTAASYQAEQLFGRGVPSVGISPRFAQWNVGWQAEAVSRVPYVGDFLANLVRGAQYGSWLGPLYAFSEFEQSTIKKLRALETSPYGIAQRAGQRIMGVYGPLQDPLNLLEVQMGRFRPNVTAAFLAFRTARQLLAMVPQASFTPTWEAYQQGEISFEQYWERYKQYQAQRAWLVTPAFAAYRQAWEQLQSITGQYSMLRDQYVGLQQWALQRLSAADFQLFMREMGPTFDFIPGIGMGDVTRVPQPRKAWDPASLLGDRAADLLVDRVYNQLFNTQATTFRIAQGWATTGYAAYFGEIPYWADWLGTSLDPFMARGGISPENPLPVRVYYGGDPNAGQWPMSPRQQLWARIWGRTLMYTRTPQIPFATDEQGNPIGGPLGWFTRFSWNIAGMLTDPNAAMWKRMYPWLTPRQITNLVWEVQPGGVGAQIPLPSGGWFNPNAYVPGATTYAAFFGGGTPPVGARGLGPMAGWTYTNRGWVYTSGGAPSYSRYYPTQTQSDDPTRPRYIMPPPIPNDPRTRRVNGGRYVTQLSNGRWTRIFQVWNPDTEGWVTQDEYQA